MRPHSIFIYLGKEKKKKKKTLEVEHYRAYQCQSTSLTVSGSSQSTGKAS